MKLSEVAQRQAQHLIVFGDPKVGKSVIVGNLAKHFKLLWFSLDGGHSVLYKLPPEAQANIELIALPDTKDFPIAIETCLKVIKGGKHNVCNLHGKVSCFLCLKSQAPFTSVELDKLGLDWIIVWDHISQLADSALNHIMKDMGEDSKPGWDEWAKQGGLMSKFFTNIQHSPQNHICMAHCLEAELEDGKVKVFPQCGTRNFSRGVGKYFDHVIHCDVRNKKHTFGSSTTYLPLILTGSRSDVSLESMKEGEVSLLPCFSIQTTASVAGIAGVAGVGAKSVLTEVKKEITKS